MYIVWKTEIRIFVKNLMDLKTKFFSNQHQNILGILVFSFISVDAFCFPSILKLKAKDTPLLSWNIQELSIVCLQASKWKPVVMQIDEINAAGDFVLDQGYPYTKFTEDGYLDENDEILVSLDSCDEIPASDKIQQADVEAKYLKIESSSTTQKILGFFSKSPLKSNISPYDYKEAISKQFYFDKTKNKMITPQYVYKFREDNPALLGEVLIDKKVLLNHARMIMPMQTPWFLPNHIFKEDSFKSEIESWKLGPLRNIVAVGVKYTSFLGLFNFHLFSELLFYVDGFEIPTRIEMPFSANKVLKYGSGIAYFFDFVEELDIQIKETDIPSLQNQSLDTLKNSPAKQRYFLLVNSVPIQKSVLIQIQTAENAASMSKSPFFITKSTKASPTSSYFPWLKTVKEDLGIFVDFSGLSEGDYAFKFELNILDGVHTHYSKKDTTPSPKWLKP